MDPKNGPVWKSNKYRKWIRDNCDCFVCGCPLAHEKENFLTHHHRHSGGKNPRDQLLVPLCLRCHNELHFNEPKFWSAHGFFEETFCEQALITLIKYFVRRGNAWDLINNMGEFANGVE